MDIEAKVCVVTGGASGIGEWICRKFAAAGAKAVVVVDIDEAGIGRVAEEVGGIGMVADVSREADIQRVVEDTEAQCGPIDIFVSNAGVIALDGAHAASCPNEDWERLWGIHVMAHVYAARALLPGFLERGDGYFVNTASAAGLLSQIGSAPYSVTKHAAVGFAESLAITHGEDGIKVSVLCPQAVRTGMTTRPDDPIGSGDTGPAGGDGMLEPDDVADMVLDAIREERFMILPHPEVETYMQRKTGDYGRWIKGMQRFRRNFVS